MKNETIELGNGKIEVLKDGDLIYLKVYGEFTDLDAIEMTKYLENFFAEMGGPTTRIWDGTHIDSGQFKLTSQGIELFWGWAERIKMKWPGTVAYFIGDKPLIYGVSRMYEIKTADKHMPMFVVRKFEEMPEDIKNRITMKDRQRKFLKS